MKALVITKPGPKNVEVRDVKEPSIGPNDIMVRVKASGICGTDVLLYNWTYSGRKWKCSREWTCPVGPPLILGHEAVGEVVKLGSRVKDKEINVGSRVNVMAIGGCGRCYYCRMNLINLCPNWIHLGVNKNGTHAEYVVVPWNMVQPLPDAISWEDGAFIEPISIAVNTLEKIGTLTGRSVVVIGPGPLGFFHLQLAKVSGASITIMVGLKRDSERLKLAKKLWADEILYSNRNIGERVKDNTEEYECEFKEEYY